MLEAQPLQSDFLPSEKADLTMLSNAVDVGPGRRVKRPRCRRSQRLLRAVRSYDEMVILMHDNPDPDAIASGWAIAHLIDAKLQKPCRLVAGGNIVRAENRYMVQVLQPPLELIDDLTLTARSGVILVDCGLQAANRLSVYQRGQIVGVIDHHRSSRRVPQLPFQDIRPTVAASATIAAGYLREQHVAPHCYLATALLYALKTETVGGQTYFSATDRAILPWLTKLADPQLLAEIQEAPLRRVYYRDMVLALQSTLLYGETAFCLLPRAEGPEVVGEVADTLIRCEGVHRVWCGAVIGEDLAISVRTDACGGDACSLVQEMVRGIGHGGGHSNRAGGILKEAGKTGSLTPALKSELKHRWLTACGLPTQDGQRLISVDEIVNHL